jgi:hypothetical protein
MPGGFKDLSCSLLRRLGGEESLFDRVRVYGPGGRTAWDGRLVQFPREDLQVNPGAVGWSSHLRDDPSFREIYVDRDLGHWGQASVQRQINLMGSFNPSFTPSVEPDAATGQPSLRTAVSDAWTTYLPLCEAQYVSGNVPLGSLYYAWKMGGATISAADANWFWAANIMTTDVVGSIDASGSLRAAGPGTGTVTATTSDKMVAMVNLYYNAAPAGAAGTLYPIYWTCLAVYGTHGLTKQGTASATEAQGFYGHDLVRDIVTRTAPLLTVTTGTGGVEPNTSFVVPQAAFLDPTTGEQALMLINGYFLWEWGVYEDKQFFWRAPDPDRLV